MSEATERSTHRAALIALLFTLGATAWSMWSTISTRSSVPQRASWAEAADYVEARWRIGDRVTWYPSWAGEAPLALHGLETLRLPHRGEVDVGRARRLWVLGAMGYDGARLISGEHLRSLQPLKLVNHHIINREGSGPISISLLTVERGRALQDLTHDLSSSEFVEVSRSARGKAGHAQTDQQCDLWALEGWHCRPRSAHAQAVKRCLSRPLSEKLRRRSKRRDLYQLDRRRWLPYIDCGLHPTEHVSRDWRVIGGEPRRCVWLSPHAGRELTLKWTPAPLGRASAIADKMTADQITDKRQSASDNASLPRALWLAWGWEDLAVRHPFRSSRAKALELTVKRGNRVIWNQRLEPRLGWHRDEISLRPSLSMGPPEPFLISVRATRGVSDASLCIDLTTRDLLSE